MDWGACLSDRAGFGSVSSPPPRTVIYEEGKYDLAVAWLSEAVELKGMNPVLYSSLGPARASPVCGSVVMVNSLPAAAGLPFAREK